MDCCCRKKNTVFFLQQDNVDATLFEKCLLYATDKSTGTAVMHLTGIPVGAFQESIGSSMSNKISPVGLNKLHPSIPSAKRTSNVFWGSTENKIQC